MTASFFYDNCHIISRQLPGDIATQHPGLTETSHKPLPDEILKGFFPEG